MTKPLSIIASVCLIVLTGAVLFVASAAVDALNAWGIVGGQASAVLRQSAQTSGDLQQTVTKVNTLLDKTNDTLDYVTRPCSAKDKNGKALKDGVICQVTKLETEVRNLVVLTHQQVSQSSVLVDSASSAIKGAAADVHTMAVAGTGTLNAATGTINAFQPVIGQTSAAVAHFDDLLTSPDTTGSLHDFHSITTAWAGTSDDFHIWSHNLWNPDPCTNAKCKWGRGFKMVGGYLQLGAQAAEASTFLRAIPVTVK